MSCFCLPAAKIDICRLPANFIDRLLMFECETCPVPFGRQWYRPFGFTSNDIQKSDFEFFVM